MAILEVVKVSQEFGGLRALDGVSLKIEEGEIFGLIGPNGAGKTTLFNLITGIYRPSSGQVFFKGRDITNLKSYLIARAGIARTFQNIRLFKKLSALDNVKVGFNARNKRRRESGKKPYDYLEMVGLGHRAMDLAEGLPYGEQRKLEIARALALEPKLLLLDEPAAGMNASEKEELLELIRRLRDMGITILLVEHDMNVVMNVCERIAVLDYGRKIAEGGPDEIRRDPKVIQSYLGVSL